MDAKAKSELRVLVIGGGYCGLAAAIELGNSDTPYVLVERSNTVGGLSRTLHTEGADFELGPHIYFNRDPEVTAFWQRLIGDDLRQHERNTRIFYQGKYIKSPLSILDTLSKLGPGTLTHIIFSFLHAKLRKRPVLNAEDWVVSNFGRELYLRFFKVYNEKIWGLASADIASDWAGQRIKSSLISMIARSIIRDPSFIVKSFDFPLGGSQKICRAQEAIIRQHKSGELRLASSPERIERTADGFVVNFAGQKQTERFTHVISTIHLDDLSNMLTYPGKDQALLNSTLEGLLYRNLVLVNLVMSPDQVRSMHEHWIDIHDPQVTALRVTNFSNYRSGDPSGTVALGVEYNAFSSDDLWSASDEEMVAQALSDLRRMRLVNGAPLATNVRRVERAYPVYFNGYQQLTATIFSELCKVDGLILAGRNSMYKWNNMHHSVKTGLMAARNILGAGLDLTTVKGNVTIGKDSD